MKVVIAQPRYLPALFFLKRINYADKIIFLDNIQRSKRDFENRNKLILGGKEKFLTIPVGGSSRRNMKNISLNNTWIEQHKRSIHENYKGHKNYDISVLYEYYKLWSSEVNVYSEVLINLMINIMSILNIDTYFSLASQYPVESGMLKGHELIKFLLKESDATEYICGINGKEYGVTSEYLSDIGCKVVYHDTEPVIPANENHLLGFFDAVFNYGIDAVRDCVSNKILQEVK